MSMVPTVDRYFLLLALILQTSKCILFESYPFTFSMSSLKQHTQYFMYSRVLFDHIFVCKMSASKWSPQKFAHSPSTWLDPAKYLIQDVTPGGSVILSGRIVRFWREHLKNGYIRLISYQLGFFSFSYQTFLLNDLPNVVFLQVFWNKVCHLERLVKPGHATFVPWKSYII